MKYLNRYRFKKNLPISHSLETIKAWNYFKIDETNDLSYLNINYDEFASNPILEGKHYYKKWEDIKKEYIEKTADGEVELYLKGQTDILKIQVILNIVGDLAKLYMESTQKERIAEALAQWGVRMDGDFFTNLDNIKSFISIQKNMLKIAIEKVKPKDTGNNVKSNMYKMKLHLERSLEKNDIDLKKINMLYFVEMINVAKKISENHGK